MVHMVPMTPSVGGMVPERRARCVTRLPIDARGALWIALLFSMTLFLATSAGADAASASALEGPGPDGEPITTAGHAAQDPSPAPTEVPSDPTTADDLGPAADPQATSSQPLSAGLPSSLLIGIGAVAAVTASGLLFLHDRRTKGGAPREEAPRETPGEQRGDQAPSEGEIEADSVTVAFPADLPPGLGGILRLGQQAVDRGEYEDAAVWFRTALDVRPDLPVAHLCLGLCRGELEGPEAALDSLDQAIELDPTDAMARYCRAQALAKGGRTGEVIDALAPLTPGTEALADTILSDPAFAELRDHPRLLALLGRL